MVNITRQVKNSVCDHSCAPISIFISQKIFYLHILTLCLDTHQRGDNQRAAQEQNPSCTQGFPVQNVPAESPQSVWRVVNQSTLATAPRQFSDQLQSRKAAISTAVFAQTEMPPRHLELLSLILKIRLLNTV